MPSRIYFANHALYFEHLITLNLKSAKYVEVFETTRCKEHSVYIFEKCFL